MFREEESGFVASALEKGGRSQRRRIRLAVLLLVTWSFAVYLPTAYHGFTRLDDDRYIYENPQVRRGLTGDTVRWALTSTEHANWYPLRRLSHLLDVSVFGMWAGGHHLVSAAWHASAAALLFFALHAMTGATGRSFTVAAIFGTHPLQVESVAWAAERSNVLAGFFFSLTLVLWVSYARRPGWWRYGAVLIAGAFGMAAKPVLMTLPFLLTVLDVWPLNRVAWPRTSRWRNERRVLQQLLLEKVPLLALAAVSGAIALAVHRQHGALASLESIPLGMRLGNAALSYWRYLGKLVWPSRLAVFYPHPMQDGPSGAALFAGVLLVALTCLVLARFRRQPWLSVGWLWYVGMLLPMIGIVQFGNHAMADRFAYLASAGIFLSLVWLVAERESSRGRGPALLGVAASVLLAGLTAASIAQVRLWKDDLTLYTHALSATERNWMAHFLAGTVLAGRGVLPEATAHLEESVRFNPAHADAWSNLGGLYAAQGRFDEAERTLRQAVRINPGLAAARFNLGFRLMRRGDLSGANEQYRALRSLDPAAAESLRRFLAAAP